MAAGQPGSWRRAGYWQPGHCAPCIHERPTEHDHHWPEMGREPRRTGVIGQLRLTWQACRGATALACRPPHRLGPIETGQHVTNAFERASAKQQSIKVLQGAGKVNALGCAWQVGLQPGARACCKSTPPTSQCVDKAKPCLHNCASPPQWPCAVLQTFSTHREGVLP